MVTVSTMKFSTTKTDIQVSLQKLSKITPTRSTIPILSNVLITTDNGSIIMRATDLEQTMILTIPASIEKEGSSVIPVDTLLNIANELPDGRITLSVDKKLNISIKSETGDYDLKGMSPEEFPAPPELDKQSPVIFSSELFLQLQVEYLIFDHFLRAFLGSKTKRVGAIPAGVGGRGGAQ